MADREPRELGDWLDYGAALRYLRQERGFGLNDLATRAGVSPSYLSEVERGIKRPSTDVLARLAGAFGMAPSELLAYIEASGIAGSESARSRVVDASAFDMAAAPEPQMGPAVTPASPMRTHGTRLESPAATTVSPDAARERSLQTLLRIARVLPDGDVELLLDLARRLLGRGRT